MADIKTKDNAKGTIRTIDKAAVATQRMKQAYIATKEKAERSVNANSSSAEEYASDKLESGIDEVVHDGAYAFDKAGRKELETTKENIKHSSISVLSIDPEELPEESYGETNYELLSDEDFEVNKNLF